MSTDEFDARIAAMVRDVASSSPGPPPFPVAPDSGAAERRTVGASDGRAGHRWWLAVAAAMVVVVAGGAIAVVTRHDNSTTASPGTTETTMYASGDSGMFVVEPVPEGWEIDRSYAQDQGSGVYYAKGGNQDVTFAVLSFNVDPSDPNVVNGRQAMENEQNGITRVEINGHDAFRMALTDDGRTYGDQIQWFARPDLLVAVQAPWDSGLDVVALATDAREISVGARDSLTVATTGGGTAGAPVEALRGTVDGDEWVLTATLPTDYPLQPADQRRGCATLSFRGESATTCTDGFTTLDNANQAILGGVNFGFGVLGGGTNDVELHLPVSGGGPAHPAETATLPMAPGLTWFATTFDEVCDRTALTASGGSVIVAAPSGYPHRNDCSS